MKKCECQRFGRNTTCTPSMDGRRIVEHYGDGVMSVGTHPTKIFFCRDRTKGKIEKIIFNLFKPNE